MNITDINKNIKGYVNKCTIINKNPPEIEKFATL